MALEIKAKEVLKNFEATSPEEFLDLLNQIKNHFKSKITQEYLDGKLKAISETKDEKEKKKLCKNLTPYFDWYLQGL